jgi:PAS domain S-box-containing protein
MRILQSPRRWQLSLAFYLMAIIGVMTIVATLYLSEVTRRTIQGSVESNQSWANRLATLTELQQAVVDLNVRAKASDKLDATRVRVRRSHALRSLDEILARLRSDLRGGLTLAEESRVSDALSEIAAEVNALIVDSDLALDWSEVGDAVGATAATAAMDQHLAHIIAASGRLQQTIQALQRQTFAQQQLYLGDVQNFKYAFSAVVLVLVGTSIFIGGRVSRLAREVDESRHSYLESLEERDRDLHLANERLEAAIAERTTELKVSEGKFRTLVGNIPGACYRCADDADYTMEFISDAIIDICGYPASDFIGSTVRTYASIIHPDDLNMVAEVVGAGLAARRQYTIEYRVIHRDGAVRWVYEKGQGVFAADGAILHVDGAILDITERRRMEIEFRENEQRLKAIFSNVPGACYRAAHDLDFTMEFISDAIENIAGYPAGDFIGNRVRSFVSIIHPDDRDMVERVASEAVQARRPYMIEYRLVHSDGSIRWVHEKGQAEFDDDGEVRHLDGAIFDISDNREIREELAASEQKFKSLLTNIPGAVYRCAFDDDYTIAFVSDVIEDISGYPASDFVDNRVRSYASIIHPDDYVMVGEMTDETRSESHRSSIEYRIIHRDGSVRWVYDRGQGVYGVDGKLLHIDGAIFDITTRKDLETQLVDQKQMATIGQVAATVSHELRNPLGAIRNSMALVRQLTRDKQLGIDRALDRVDRNIERCTTIISELLDFTRRKELNRQPTSIDAWLEEMLAEQTLPPDVALERELGASDEVTIDRDKFRQVVVNLIENAAQALQDATWQPPEGHRRCIIVRTETAGPHVRLSVIDSGPGIPREVMDRIFEPLFTTKSFGVGLGLPTVRQIVEQHGGTINVESRINEGSTFTIWLPRQGEAASHPGESTSREAAA